MRAETEAALIETGYCWVLQYYQSLELDEEAEAVGMPPPKDHWHVTIYVSYEDIAEGWGSTSDAAAFEAMGDLEKNHTWEI